MAGKSGFGDGGAHAIQEFKEQHQCNTLCDKLKLQPLDELDELDDSCENTPPFGSDINTNGEDDDEQNLFQGESSVLHSHGNPNPVI